MSHAAPNARAPSFTPNDYYNNIINISVKPPHPATLT